MASCSPYSDDQFGPRVALDCRSFDFTLLFEDAILATLPAAVLLLVLPSRLRILHNAPSKLGSYKLALWKMLLLAALFVFQLLFLAFRSQTATLKTKASLPADTLQVFATCAAIYASFMEDQRSVRPSDILTLYFSASIILSLTRLRTLWLISSVTVCRVLGTSVFICTVLTLLVECFTKAKLLRPRYQDITKEQAQSIWGRTFFTYNIPFFRAGFSKILKLDDVPAVDEDLQGEVAGAKLRGALEGTKGSRRLIWAAFRAYPVSLLSAVVPRLLLAGFTFAQPFLITATVEHMQSEVTESSKHYGAALVGAYVFVYLGLATTTSIYWRQTYRLLTVLRSGLIAVIYERTLVLKSKDLGDATAITLMGTDVERIIVSLKNLHEVWASVLEVGVALWLLERQLWVACLVPLVLALGSVFAVIPVSSKSGAAQKAWIECVQKRLAVTSSMLKDMKLVQMLGLSDMLEKSVSQLRNIEIKTSMRFRKLLIWQIALSNVGTDLAPFATFGVYAAIVVARGNETLLASKAFTALALISLLTNPLLKFCQVLPALFQVVSCFGRIEEYCSKEVDTLIAGPEPQSDELLQDPAPAGMELQHREQPHISADSLVSLQDATVAKSPGANVILHEIDLRIQKGITMVVGPVGSGKSTLLETILGENTLLSGSAHLSLPKVAYCPQTSWIQNATIRQNILGPLEYDEKWYEFTISACGLESDLKTMLNGDASVTGSTGAALSGGQKQRIALARAVYSRLEVVILDDIFSGLDSRTAMLIRDRLFGQDGHFRKAGRSAIFATNSASMFKLADDVIILEEGRVVAQGSYARLVERSPQIAARFLSSTHHPKSSSLTDLIETLPADNLQSAPQHAKTKEEENLDILRQKGSWSIYGYYFRSSGYIYLFLAFLFTCVECFCNAFGAIWLQWWVEANERKPNQQLGLYLGVYALIFTASLTGLLAGCWAHIIKVLNNGSINMHKDLLKAVVNAPIVHFQKTDTGTLTNRFGQDFELIDMALPMYSIQFLTAVIICLIRLVILCAIGKYLAGAIPLLLLVLYVVQSFYLRTSRQVRLLDIEAKAPLYTHFTETIQGIASIRAYGWNSAFKSKSQDLLNQSQKPVYMLFCIQQWLTLVLDLVVGGIAVILIAIITSWKDKFNPVQIGVALNMLLSFNFALAQAIKMWTMMEMSIGAVSRVHQFVVDTPSEEQDGKTAASIPAEWPSRGVIEFHEVNAVYSPNTSALANINLTLAPGSKSLICGASGSGKTSLLMSLLHMLPITSGHITIDGIDTSTIPPHILRLSLNVIPQEAFFMPGSLRHNLDPRNLASDQQITSALQKVGMWDKLQDAGGLGHDFDKEKWSVGQRQLLALARALLVKSPILVLDETTSSVDHETETLMLKVIVEEFKEQTVLSVAHRLRNLEWYDKIVVVKQQRIVEQGGFEELVAAGGEFFRLWSAGGVRVGSV